VLLCALNGTCAELTATCQVGTIVPTLATAMNQALAQQLARDSFPYARFQFWLRSELQVQNPRGCLFARTGGGGGGAGPDSSSSDSSSGSGGGGGGGGGSSSQPPCPSYYNYLRGKGGGNPPWWVPADCYEPKAMSPLEQKKLLFLLRLN
jgi:hypothetical protein